MPGPKQLIYNCVEKEQREIAGDVKQTASCIKAFAGEKKGPLHFEV